MPMHVGIDGKDKTVSDIYAVINGKNQKVTDVYMVEDGSLNHTYTSQGQKVFTSSGIFTVPAGVKSVDVFVVGGGGGGGKGKSTTPYQYCGSGGGGGYTTALYGISVNPGEQYPVTVGAGAKYNSYSCGGESSALGVTAKGGWSGYYCTSEKAEISGYSVFAANISNGGSGGGQGGVGQASSNTAGGSGGSHGCNGYTYRYETDAPLGDIMSNGYGVGQNYTTDYFGISAYEQSAWYGGGGSGGSWMSSAGKKPIAGWGGGGSGAVWNTDTNTVTNQTDGVDGTGGGGGGGYHSGSNSTGNGGSGIVIIRWGYEIPEDFISYKGYTTSREYDCFTEEDFVYMLNKGLITTDYIGKDIRINYTDDSGIVHPTIYTIEDINHTQNRGRENNNTVDAVAKYPVNVLGTASMSSDSDGSYYDMRDSEDLRYVLNNMYYGGLSDRITEHIKAVGSPHILPNGLTNMYSNNIRVMSCTEAGIVRSDNKIEGTTYPRYNDSLCLDDTSKSRVNRTKTNYDDNTHTAKGNTPIYWLRSSSSDGRVFCVYSGVSSSFTPTNKNYIVPAITFTQNCDNTKLNNILAKPRIYEEDLVYCLKRRAFTSEHIGKEVVLTYKVNYGYKEEVLERLFIIADVDHSDFPDGSMNAAYGSIDLITADSVGSSSINATSGSYINGQLNYHLNLGSTSEGTPLIDYKDSVQFKFGSLSDEIRALAVKQYIYDDCYEYVKIPSTAEMGISLPATILSYNTGTAYPIFSSAESRKLTVGESTTKYFTRTEYNIEPNSYYYIDENGNCNNFSKSTESQHIRPIIRLMGK